MTFRGMDFLIVIDYFSNWLEIIRLQGKTAAHLTIKFKEIFSRYGIPEELVSDNMPFDSYEFRRFATEWDFSLSTSSPRYPQSNGMAERGVQIAKNILRKSYE
ncbi:hypothetical protein TcasGA2_TC002322 [Tribolium castaneum]|uniref:Integrase catalytic domain-containing protein n=1 Tax=Tribolium castaneum TaxID=7070 RepID=D7EHW5_TRICA|nr:hypothetical protein TcasGA2_TC002322 [Tribolium castaneum]